MSNGYPGYPLRQFDPLDDREREAVMWKNKHEGQLQARGLELCYAIEHIAECSPEQTHAITLACEYVELVNGVLRDGEQGTGYWRNEMRRKIREIETLRREREEIRACGDQWTPARTAPDKRDGGYGWHAEVNEPVERPGENTPVSREEAQRAENSEDADQVSTP